MHRELHETPARLSAQIKANAPHVASISKTLWEAAPPRWFVVGRGTSAHAGAFFRYAMGLLSGRLISELPPSLMTVYARRMSFTHALLIAISQSGAGADINHVATQFNAAGGMTLALTNAPDSELARRAHYCLLLRMGPEKAVAATKTFLGTITALIQLSAAISGDHRLEDTLFRLPAKLKTTADDALLAPRAFALFKSPMFVIGRGLGLAIAREIALKFKEVCRIHAEAYSAAEFRHGPMALAGPGCPILLLCLDDETRPQMLALAHEIDALGAPTVLIGSDLPAMPDQQHSQRLSLPATGSVYTDAVMATFQIYDAIERLAVSLGLDPDRPAHISKITSTY
jgi:glucosamine--fructose-6-phosphate aminotransferase (isomerizing)